MREGERLIPLEQERTSRALHIPIDHNFTASPLYPESTLGEIKLF